MTDAAVTLTDTSTWLPLDELAPGFDANKAQHSLDLAGREVAVVDERGTRIVHRFGEHTVAWEYQPGVGDPTQAAAKSDDYEAFLVDDELYFVQFHHEYLPNEAISLVLDFRGGRALTVVSVILTEPTPSTTRVQHVFVPSRIEGVDATGSAPAPTTTLIGRRVQWVYSDKHVYEHIYLSPQWYTWQCLAGPERGLADTDENSVWQVRPGIYVFAWREKVIPCGSVTIADHRDAREIRSHGVLFGLDESGAVPTHFTFGAHGRLISTTVHPAEFDPAGA
jgi:hypothetical protein